MYRNTTTYAVDARDQVSNWNKASCTEIKGTLNSKLALDFFSWPKSLYFWQIYTMKTISINAVVT